MRIHYGVRTCELIHLNCKITVIFRYSIMRNFEDLRGTVPVSFDQNGLSRNVELNVLNVQVDGYSNAWSEVWIHCR